MGLCIPEPIWQGQDAYIIGGGNSLENFDWGLLRGYHTIGCNDAYSHGVSVCNVCIFGDAKWYYAHSKNLQSYEGVVYCGDPALLSKNLPDRILHVKRYAKGLQTDGLGWNGNTGLMAVNLAILLGAASIYLLGFDMKRLNGKSNWHDNNLDKNPDSVYKKFLDWSKYVKQDWENKFSHIQIFNITDDSDLNIFPKIGTKEFWMRKAIA